MPNILNGIKDSLLPFIRETQPKTALLFGRAESEEIRTLLSSGAFTNVVIADSTTAQMEPDALFRLSGSLSSAGINVFVVPDTILAMQQVLNPGADLIWFGNRPEDALNISLAQWKYAVNAGGALTGFFGSNGFTREETSEFARWQGSPELIDDNDLWLIPMPTNNSHRHTQTRGFMLSSEAAPAWAEAYLETSKLIGLFGVTTGSEIGVARGHHSAHLLEAHPGLKWFSIDPWRHFEIGYEDPANMPQPEFDKLYKNVCTLLQPFGDRSVILRNTSEEASPMFDEGTLDMVFIDANHSYEAVGEDLRYWWGAVKPGGIFAGHDYGHPNFPGVQQAVDEFLTAMGLMPSSLGGTVWWVKKPGDASAQHQEMTPQTSRIEASQEILKIHIGCGPRVLKGWVNIDLAFEPYENYLQYYTDEFYGPEVRGSREEFRALDVTKEPLPFPDESADIIFDEDFLEHLDQREAILFLAESYRVLKPGGVHRIITPDLDWVFDTKCSLKEGYKGFDQSEWIQWHHKEIFSKTYLEYIASRIGYRVSFRKRFESVSPYLPKEYRPGKGIPEESHLYADLIKPGK